MVLELGVCWFQGASFEVHEVSGVRASRFGRLDPTAFRDLLLKPKL